VLLHQLLIQDKTSLEVDMNKSLPNGVYILQIFTKNNRIQRKILKL